MFTKAVMMNDVEMCNEIVDSSNPKDCKALGRGVRNFDEALWQERLEETAFEVVKQKFASAKGLREVLLSTGDAILAEAAPNDCIWGVGLPLGDARVLDPWQWRGRNVLGTALMKTRDFLRGATNAASCHTTLPAAKVEFLEQGEASCGASASTDPHALPEQIAASSDSNSNSLTYASADQVANVPSLPVAASVPQLPIMEGPEAEVILVYSDADADGSDRLSSAEVGSAPLRLLFLDVDGVLNNKSQTTSGDELCGSDLFSENLCQLQTALDATGAHVVLSSTWRSDSQLRTEIVQTLENMRPGCVVGQTPQDPSYRNDMRPAEIASFLEEPRVAQAIASSGVIWCAVDDMDLLKQAEALASKGHVGVQKLLPALRQGFVRTDKAVGLDAAGAINIQQALSGTGSAALNLSATVAVAPNGTRWKRSK